MPALKEAGQKWLDTMEDSAANGEATKAYIAALESSICTVDELLANPKAEIHAFGEELKAKGETLCQCDACKLAAEILADKEFLSKKSMWIFGGDGWAYDIGFGGLDHVLASGEDVNILVFDTEVYSNTGGQASTSSFIGQDSDLARIGAASSGKQEARKELGLIASFHSNVFVCSTSTALQNHFLKNTMEFLTYTDSPAVLDVYTPCQGEHGIADNISAQQGRLAVESRMNPVFVHDPRRGKNLHDWFSLEGNPDVDKTWTTTTLEYVDDKGQLQLKEMPGMDEHCDGR